jgi:glycosyltransferase involved in cell wall biosynthesis
LLVPPRHPPALADALIAQLRDEEMRKRMGAAARALALQLFDESRVAATVVARTTELLKRKKDVHPVASTAAAPTESAGRPVYSQGEE